jgi:hypothetical protein
MNHRSEERDATLYRSRRNGSDPVTATNLNG